MAAAQLLLFLLFVNRCYCQSTPTLLPAANATASPLRELNSSAAIQLADVTPAETLNLNVRRSVVKLRHHFKEEKLPDYIVDTIYSGEGADAVTAADIVRLARLDNCTLEDAKTLLGRLNATVEEVCTVDAFAKLLNVTGTSFAAFYESLTRKLHLGGAQVGAVLDQLHIDQSQFAAAVTFGLSNIFDVLRNGTYSREAVAGSLSAIGADEERLFRSARDVLLEAAAGVSAAHAAEIVVGSGLGRPWALAAWRALDISTEDVYRVEGLRSLLGNAVSRWNSGTLIGVVVAPDRIVVHKAVQAAFCRNDAVRIAADVDGSEIELVAPEKFVTDKIVSLGLRPNATAFVHTGARGGGGGGAADCLYVDCEHRLFPVDVGVGPNASFSRNDTEFCAGAPLICGGRLVGLAGGAGGKSIFFDEFPGREGENAIISENQPGESKGTRDKQTVVIFLGLLLFATGNCVYVRL